MSRSVKHELFSYSNSTMMAGRTIEFFYSDEDEWDIFWDDEFESIVPRLMKPHKETVLHLYLDWIDSLHQGINEDMKNLNTEDLYTYFSFYDRMLKDLGVEAKEGDIPDFDLIEECHHCGGCDECEKLNEYIEWIASIKEEFLSSLIHSTFHVLMLNKQFLRDFHERIGDYIKRDKRKITDEFPSALTNKGTIKRPASWQSWLKRGIFYRDKGVCTICRNPLSGDLFLGIDPDMDHIVPLALYGNNDPSNLQILCNVCNNKKRDHDSTTSSFDIPFWNLDVEI